MKVNQFNSDNINRLVKIQKYLNENYDINVGKILPQKKLDTAYKNVEQRITNLRNKGSKFQQDPNYGMNIMVKDALGIMIKEGMYYEGENYRRLMDELYEYGCSLAESGDDYDTVMASCSKKYDVMPARYPKDMVLASLGEQMTPMFENPALLSIARAGAAGAGFGAAGGQVNASLSPAMATVTELDVNPTDKLHTGLAKILNKDRISLKPANALLKDSAIIVNIYEPSPRATKDKPATPTKSIRYYGVYPVSYNLGSLDYSSSDVVVGSIKFYFYGMDIKDPEDAKKPSTFEDKILNSIGRDNKSCMGNYK